MTKKLIFILFLSGFLSPCLTYSQENDSLLALKYYTLGRKYKSNEYFTELAAALKNDSTYKYTKLALPLLRRAKLWEEFSLCARWIAKYEYMSNKEGSIAFLQNAADTLIKYNQPEVEKIYFSLASIIKKDSPYLYIKYLQKMLTENTSLRIHQVVLFSLGQYFLEENIFDSSLFYYTKHLNKAKETKKSVPKAYKRISDLYVKWTKYDQALMYIDSAIINSQTIKDRALYLNDKGGIFNLLGNYEKAFEYCELALKEQLKETYKEPRSFAARYYNIGVLLHTKGDFLRSNEFLDQAISLLENQYSDNNSLLNSLNLKSLNYVELFDFEKAFEFASKYRALLKKNNVDTSYIFSIYGKIYFHLGNYDSSLIYYKLSEKKSLPVNEFNMGELYYKLQEYSLSRSYFEKFINRISIKSAKDNHPLIITAKKYIGDNYFNEGKFDSALVNYNEALKLAGINQPIEPNILNEVLQKDLTFVIFEIFWRLSETYSKIYESSNETDYLLKNHSYLIAASGLLNNYKFYLESVKSKLFWTEKTSLFYDDVIRNTINLFKLLKDKKYLEDAFRIIELSKVNVLRSSINESNAIKLSGIPDSLAAKENEYSAKLNSLRFSRMTELQNSNPNQVKLDYFNNEIFNIQRDYSFLIKKFESDYPTYYRRKFETSIISLKQLQDKLQPDQSVLQYYLGKDDLYLLVIDKDSIYSISSDTDSSLVSEIRKFASLLRNGKLLKKKQKNEFVTSASLLYKRLLTPALRYITSKKELIIIPGGELLSVPFELLIKEPSADLNFSKLQYAIKDFTISYEYSATLGFDPKYKKYDKGGDCFVGFAPSFETNNSSTLVQQFPELLYNEEEVNQISQLFKTHNMEAEVYSGNKATEENFKKIKDCKYIHIATHSEADKDNPDLSALYFSGTLADTLNDNILYSDEIFDLKLSADLVVLSSCETGAGKLIKGEGILSLTRGFIYNGVPNLLFSLWKVSDRSTKSLMVEFYKAIIQGKDYKSALRESKLKMLTNELTSFPDKWGAFILISN